MSVKEFAKEYEEKLPFFERLADLARGMCQNALDPKDTPLLLVTSRIKTLKSATDKIHLKGYKQPFVEMTDLVGLRVAVYLSSDIEKVKDALRNLFEIDEENSIDKSEQLSPNSVGYRSTHLICSLDRASGRFNAYPDLLDIPFEIQLRTALEHTWAEIEHKHRYKPELALPKPLQRRLNILSGTLELVDRELSEIKAQAENYKSKLQNGDPLLEHDSISITSLRLIFQEASNKAGIQIDGEDCSDTELSIIIDELNRFGSHSNQDLKSILTGNLRPELTKNGQTRSISGLIRDTMILTDPNKYFNDVFEGDYLFQKSDIEMYENITNKFDFKMIMKNHDVQFVEDF